MDDYMQKDTRSLGRSLQFFQLISVLFVSHKYLVSELNWKLKLPKTYFPCLLYLICQYRHVQGIVGHSPVDMNQTSKKFIKWKRKKQSKRFTCNKRICHGLVSVMPLKAWCWHLFMDFSEAAVSISKSTGGYLYPKTKFKVY